MTKNLFLLLSIFCFTGCEYFASIEKVSFSDANPTTYVFNGTLDSVRMLILNSFPPKEKKHKEFYESLELKDEYQGFVFTVGFNIETIEHVSWGNHIFDDPLNNKDICLNTYGVPTLSQLYFIQGKPVDYRALYHLHLTSESESSTRINVIVLHPRVERGLLWGRGDFTKKADSLEPTTIEEYKILLYIGCVLGEKNMPDLKLPQLTR